MFVAVNTLWNSLSVSIILENNYTHVRLDVLSSGKVLPMGGGRRVIACNGGLLHWVSTQ